MSTTALLLVLAAAVCHAGWNVVAHGVSRLGTPFLWWGAVASAVLWLPVVPFTGGLGASAGGLAVGAGLSAVLHVVYMTVLQRGYAAGNLSTVYATARGTGPAVSAGLAVLLLGEQLPVTAVVGIAVVVVGVVATGLIDRQLTASASPRLPGVPDAAAPTRPRRRLDPGIAWGLLTGLAIASYTIWDAHALRTWGLSPVSFMVGVTLGEVVFYSATLGRRRREIAVVLRAHWPRVLAFGVLSPLSYILVLTAIQTAPVALVAPARETSVVMVAVFGALVLREGSLATRLAASLVVLGGIALLAL
jgi:drug/metabolite transporter (DMT)-like permease